LVYEVCWSAYLVFVLYRVGRNFFLDSWLHNTPLLASEFYIPAALFLVLWGALLVMAFTRRLRTGLEREVHSLAGDLVQSRLAGGLFPDVDAACRQTRGAIEELRGLRLMTSGLQAHLQRDSSGLGAIRQPAFTVRSTAAALG
jgi:hypothetical protein